jgi:hypothetical protein
LIDTKGPQLDLDTLRYQVTDSLTGALDEDAWLEPTFRVLSATTSGNVKTYGIAATISVEEGKENFIWWSASDASGNSGMTQFYDLEKAITDYGEALMKDNDTPAEQKSALWQKFNESATKKALETNPSNIWVDTSALAFSDQTPSTEPLEENFVTASIIVSDDMSGVDASTIQYSVSRNGIENYGGWISATTSDDANTIMAETVSDILFEPGSVNYIRWRARDVAGNGYFISPDYQINIVPIPSRSPPTAIITAPFMNQVNTTQDFIVFDATSSSDPDIDETLTYEWVMGNRSVISNSASFKISAKALGPGIKIVTVYVSDGVFTDTDSISFYVKVHPDEADTDKDGTPDGSDFDDDEDGLTDEEELELGTNPRIKDSDSDGYDDKVDDYPLNPQRGPEDKKNLYSYYDVMFWVLLLSAVILLLGVMLVMKKRSTVEKNRIERTVSREARLVSRYEALTGIDAPLLPHVRDMGLSLPPVAAQQVVPIRKESASKPRTPSPITPREPAKPAPAPQQPPQAPNRRGTAGSTPGSIPTPEALTKTQSLPTSAAGRSTSCDLCGSSIEVPAGSTIVECPLCGEKKKI